MFFGKKSHRAIFRAFLGVLFGVFYGVFFRVFFTLKDTLDAYVFLPPRDVLSMPFFTPRNGVSLRDRFSCLCAVVGGDEGGETKSPIGGGAKPPSNGGRPPMGGAVNLFHSHNRRVIS